VSRTRPVEVVMAVPSGPTQAIDQYSAGEGGLLSNSQY
jgi:hypothetical protein